LTDGDLAADLSLPLRLLVAAVLSGVVGLERETAGKRAGLRTHIIVGISSALFVVVSQLAAFGITGPQGTVRVEPLQVIQAIAIGIGFLGAGVIRSSDERHGSGRTTAASIWATAAVGVTCALAHYALAAGATLLLLGTLRGLERFETGRRSDPSRREG